MRTGPLNLITDVAGLSVGHAEDATLKSGVSVVVADEPAIASCHVMGGAPGTRETDLLEPHNTVSAVDAIVLSGGSAFGLDAASGAQSALRAAGRGFAVGPVRVPIVPAAILFDLINGGDKDWGLHPPYRDLGLAATRNAARDFSLGSVGAGTGALTAGLKGGLGSASTHLASGLMLGAMAAVNALGSAIFAGGRHFRAAEFEIGDEFGGLGFPANIARPSEPVAIKGRPATPLSSTTIAVIATDAILTKAECKRLSMAAHDGFARALWPAHLPLDGDIVFALATGRAGRAPSPDEFIDLCAIAASTMARAIARGIFSARPEPGDVMPCWSMIDR